MRAPPPKKKKTKKKKHTTHTEKHTFVARERVQTADKQAHVHADAFGDNVEKRRVQRRCAAPVEHVLHSVVNVLQLDVDGGVVQLSTEHDSPDAHLDARDDKCSVLALGVRLRKAVHVRTA
jgi:hypothetical protein